MRAISYALLLTLCLLQACSQEPQPDAHDRSVHGSADSVFAYLQQIELATLRRAFATLDSTDYRRSVRTEQLGADGAPVAREDRVIQVIAGDARLISREMEGAFDFGYLARFVSDSTFKPFRSRLSEYVLPEDPDFLSPRNREDYLYRFAGDTLVDAIPARVVEIRMREDADSEHPIRVVRLGVEDDTHRLVFVELERYDSALWYEERSRSTVSLREDREQGWLPVYSRFETALRIPFRGTQRFRTTSRYEFGDFDAPPISGEVTGERIVADHLHEQ